MADLRNTQYTVSIRNRMLDALAARCNSGYIRYYTNGTPGQPATADTAITDQVLLGELRFGNPAFAAAAAAQLTANAITDDATANATGTATWFRIFESDGATVVCDGSIGPDNDANIYNIELTTVSIVLNARLQLSAFIMPMPAGGL